MERKAILILTLLLSGRAMTLAFITRAGDGGLGDPPAAWLMPLIGDALIGLSALLIAYLVWRKAGLCVWTALVVWNAIAIWDALSAYTIHLTNPWPEFFMIQLFGSAMFFGAVAMHGLILWLAFRPNVRQQLLGTQ